MGLLNAKSARGSIRPREKHGAGGLSTLNSGRAGRLGNAEQPGRQQEDRPQERHGTFDDVERETERQAEQPNEREREQHQHRERPAQEEQQAPADEEEQKLHAQSTRTSRPEFQANSPRIALARFPARANTRRTRPAPLTMKPFQAIAAMSENRVIGQAGRIPWHQPEDFKWFKQATMGGILVMGRKTFESIGRPLPGRETVILSRSGFTAPGTRTVPSVESLDQLLAGDPRPVWIAGGAEVYSLLLSRCAQLFLTRVKRTVEGDAFFPPFEGDFFEAETVLDHPDFLVLRFQRKGRP